MNTTESQTAYYDFIARLRSAGKNRREKYAHTPQAAHCTVPWVTPRAQLFIAI